MTERLYSVEQVADLLGLHVRTVRTYVRDGRLKAIRIGKQYRISGDDLEAFTGHQIAPPARETARRVRHAEVSSIVQVDAISRDELSRVSTMITAAVKGRPAGDQNLRIETVYDQERASMKIILIGGLGTTAELLKIIDMLVDGS